MIKICDKDCPDRSATCHGECEKYQAFEAERLERQMKPSTVYGWTYGKVKATTRLRRYKARRGRKVR